MNELMNIILEAVNIVFAKQRAGKCLRILHIWHPEMISF